MAQKTLAYNEPRFGMFGVKEAAVREFILNGNSQAENSELDLFVGDAMDSKKVDPDALERDFDRVNQRFGKILVAVRDLNPDTFRKDRYNFINTLYQKHPNNEFRLVYAQDSFEVTPHLPKLPNFEACFEQDSRSWAKCWLEQQEIVKIPSALLHFSYQRGADETSRQGAANVWHGLLDCVPSLPEVFIRYFSPGWKDADHEHPLAKMTVEDWIEFM
ncbi:hypothetical protein HN832_02525 [archaeon]|jgi:hypothetical protein|nr:hypothetical protein [archaeon]MBT4373229.1 hypothetical protein [archaeon]MBT4531574.1 hypothetical protein [archaeon]MBT7001248.1 hypothetical protein [archaeon]MBT7282266.1 hypothetical protein [archaeon]